MIERNITEVQSGGARIDACVNHCASADHIFLSLDGDLSGAAAAIAFSNGG